MSTFRDNGYQSLRSRFIADNETTPPITPDGDRTEAFVRLLGQTERYRYAYLMSLHNDRHAVEEVLQETNLVLWREFDNFTVGTNFTAWSCRIAFLQLLAWQKKQRRDRLRFSEEFLTAVNQELDADQDAMEQRLAVLRECVNALPPHHRELIRCRYVEGDSIEVLATSTKRSMDAVYRMLSRVRKLLHDCVVSKLEVGGSHHG